jgi:hypothetical protein
MNPSLPAGESNILEQWEEPLMTHPERGGYMLSQIIALNHVHNSCHEHREKGKGLLIALNHARLVGSCFREEQNNKFPN